MSIFIDSDGQEHKIIIYVNHGTRQNFMITSIMDGELEFPQVWESHHMPDETPVWFSRPLNMDYTVGDILSHVILGPVAGLASFNWKDMS